MTITTPYLIMTRVRATEDEVDDERQARLVVLDWLEEVVNERNHVLRLVVEQYNFAKVNDTRLALEVILRELCHTPAGEPLTDEHGVIKEWVP